MIYVAIKTILEKPRAPKNNPKISQITSTDQHKTCGFSIFVKFTKKNLKIKEFFIMDSIAGLNHRNYENFS